MSNFENVINRCGNCKYFTGAGDWDLCCLNPPKRTTGCFGFLCYETTPACKNYETKISINSEAKINFNTAIELSPMDYLGDLGFAMTKDTAEN